MRILLFIAILLCCPQPSKGQTDANNSPANVANPNTTTLTQGNQSQSYQSDKSDGKYQDPNWVIAKLTFALVIVGCIQAYIYWRQSRLMRSALRQNRESSEIELRAYVLIERIQHHLPLTEEETIPERTITLIYKNTGQTPAHNLISHIFWDSISGSDAHLPSNYKFPGLETVDESLLTRAGSLSILGSGQTRNSEHGFMPTPKGVEFGDVYRKFLRGEAVSIFIFAKITYEDIFNKGVTKKPRMTRECVRIVKADDGAIRFLSYDMFNDVT